MKLAVFIVIAIGIVGFVFVNRERNVSEDLVSSEITSTPPPSPVQTGLRTSWFIVSDTKKLTLRSNLSSQLSAKEAKDTYECASIISGGFYSDSQTQGENGKHIGLFVSNGNTLSSYRENSLFNGFLSIQNGISSISPNVPSTSDIALQTGPLLITNGDPRKLSLTRDEKARRMVAAISSDNKLIFMVFFDASSYVSGPKLVELPELVKKLGNENNVEIISAINLDGGAHSAFITDDITLTDIQTPGSYFCVTE